MKKSGGFLHILDPNSLLGIVINANNLFENSSKIKLIEAFDYILIERMKISLGVDTPYFKFKIQIDSSGSSS